jgi:hypothetical protein
MYVPLEVPLGIKDPPAVIFNDAPSQWLEYYLQLLWLKILWIGCSSCGNSNIRYRRWNVI